MSPLLEVEHLALKLPIDGQLQPVLHDVSFSLEPGEVLALVGESGSGKSMTARSVLQLLPPHAALSGRISFGGTALLGAKPSILRELRARRIGMIFQDPRAAINPVHRIGDFMTESLVRVAGVKQGEAHRRAAGLLEEVGLDDPDRLLRMYPHELSGGMLQRVMIASVLLSEPDLLLADEPTTALDVTTQAEVVAILDDLRRARGMAMVFITHDLELAAALCNQVAVMYAGYVVEVIDATKVLESPRHPYTDALLRSRPSLETRLGRIPQVPGRPLAAYEVAAGCPFETRCERAVARCREELPVEVTIESDRVRCHLADTTAHTEERPTHEPVEQL